MRWKTSRSLIPCLAFSLGACGAGEPASQRAVVVDSAGIRIVENTAGLWRVGSGWRLSDAPVLDIGVLEGDPSYQLYRVAGSARLADGRIVVANGGTNELRFYDAEGMFLAAAGREGEGPGEFKNLGAVRVLPGDTLLAHDFRLNRISLFDAAGQFVRSFQLQRPASGGYPSFTGTFADGTLLVTTERVFRSGEGTNGVIREPRLYYRYGRDGAPIDTIGRFMASESFVKSEGENLGVTGLAFGKTSPTATAGNRFYFGTSDTYEIGIYSSDGKLETLIRKAHRNLPVTPEDVQQYKEQQLERAEGSWRQFWERMLKDMPFPQVMPAYGQFRVDTEGSLWVAEYRRPGDDQPRWTVFDPEGQMLGVVETPPVFTVHQIGSDFVLGVWKDEFDVEHVRLYRLIKPGRNGA